MYVRVSVHVFVWVPKCHLPSAIIIVLVMLRAVDRGSTVVNVVCYESEGRWFDPRWCHWYFSLT